MNRTMTIGTVLYGFCNGYFGRDSYGEKTVVACGQSNDDLWVVAREGQQLLFATGFDAELVSEWMTPDSDDH